MSEVEEMESEITLKPDDELNPRVEVLTMLYQKAETKVIHADTYRQKNMNYSLVIFAGMIALGVKLPLYLAQCIVSITLVVLMMIFCVWDRRWHRIKHGWQSTSKAAYLNICKIIDNPGTKITMNLYNAEDEKKAEFFSWQPIVYYFLVTGSCFSLLLFHLARGTGTAP